MGGKAVNGWRFWSLGGEAPIANSEAGPATKAASGKGKKTTYSIPPGKIAEAKSKWFCLAWMVQPFHLIVV